MSDYEDDTDADEPLTKEEQAEALVCVRDDAFAMGYERGLSEGRLDMLKSVSSLNGSTDAVLAFVRKAFNPNQPRNHGKFSTTGGAKDGQPDGEGGGVVRHDGDSVPVGNHHHQRGGLDPDTHATSLAARIAEVPAHVAAKVKAYIQRRYAKLAARYGETGAKAILGAMVLLAPTPIPGSSLIPIAVAEAVLAIRRAVKSGVEKAMPTLDDAHIQALAMHELHDLYEEMGEQLEPTETKDGTADTGEDGSRGVRTEGEGATRDNASETSQGVSEPGTEAEATAGQAPEVTPELELLDAAAEYAQACLTDGTDPDESLHRLYDLEPDELDAIADGTVEKAWSEDLHPRGKDGKFIGKDAIQDAKSDPAKAKELRERVKPEDAQKLEDALSGKTDLGRTKRGEAKEQTRQKREKVQANREEARAIRNRLFAQYQAGEDLNPDDMRALIPHLSTMTHAELSDVRTFLHGAGAKFGGATRLAERRQRLVEWAKAGSEKPTEPVAEQPAQPATPGDTVPSANEAAKPSSAEAEQTAVDTMHDLLAGKYATLRMVPIHEMRADFKKQHPGASDADFNEAMLDLRRSDKARLVSISDTSRHTPEQIRDSVSAVGETFFYAEPTSQTPARSDKTTPTASGATPEQMQQTAAGIQHELSTGKFAQLRMAPIHEMRAEFKKQHPGASDAEFNSAMLELRQQGKLRLISISDRSRATSDQLRNSVHAVGETFFYAEKPSEAATPAKEAAATATQPEVATPAAKKPRTAKTKTGHAAVKDMAKKERDPAAKEWLESALHNANKGDDADLAKTLGSSIEETGTGPGGHITRPIPPAAVEAGRRALQALGAEEHGAPGETAFDARYHQPVPGVFPGQPVKVVRPALVLNGNVVSRGKVEAAQQKPAPAAANAPVPSPKAKTVAAKRGKVNHDEIAASLKGIQQQAVSNINYGDQARAAIRQHLTGLSQADLQRVFESLGYQSKLKPGKGVSQIETAVMSLPSAVHRADA